MANLRLMRPQPVRPVVQPDLVTPLNNYYSGQQVQRRNSMADRTMQLNENQDVRRGQEMDLRMNEYDARALEAEEDKKHALIAKRLSMDEGYMTMAMSNIMRINPDAEDFDAQVANSFTSTSEYMKGLGYTPEEIAEFNERNIERKDPNTGKHLGITREYVRELQVGLKEKEKTTAAQEKFRWVLENGTEEEIKKAAGSLIEESKEEGGNPLVKTVDLGEKVRLFYKDGGTEDVKKERKAEKKTKRKVQIIDGMQYTLDANGNYIRSKIEGDPLPEKKSTTLTKADQIQAMIDKRDALPEDHPDRELYEQGLDLAVGQKEGESEEYKESLSNGFVEIQQGRTGQEVYEMLRNEFPTKDKELRALFVDSVKFPEELQKELMTAVAEINDNGADANNTYRELAAKFPEHRVALRAIMLTPTTLNSFDYSKIFGGD